MTEKLQQCLGGWCTRREKCAHYWAPKQKNVPPSERLCTNGTEIPLPVMVIPQEVADAN